MSLRQDAVVVSYVPVPDQPETDFERFKRLAGQIVSVPKREVDALAEKEKEAKSAPKDVLPSGV